jgi:hypothetical protein
MRIPQERNTAAWQGAGARRGIYPISDSIHKTGNRENMKPFNLRDYMNGNRGACGSGNAANMQGLMQGMGIDESLFFPSDSVISADYDTIISGGGMSSSETTRWSNIPDFTMSQ